MIEGVRGRLGRIATWVFVGAAVVFTALLMWGQWEEFRALRAQLRGTGWRFDPGLVGAAVALGVLNLFWMGAAWVRLYRAGGVELPYGRGVRAWIATNLGRYIPGKIWQLSGLALHLRRTGASGALALTSVVGFQAVALLTGAAVALGTLGGDVARIPGGSPLTAVGVLVALGLLLHPAVVRKATSAAARVLKEDTGEVRAPSGLRLLELGGAMVGAWAVYGAGFWCLLAGTLATPPAGPLLLTGIFAASYVAGYLVLVAPGGLVVREGAMTVLLAGLTPLGAAPAAAVAVAARLWVTACELLAVGMALLPAGRGRAARGGGEGEGKAGEALGAPENGWSDAEERRDA